MVEWVLELRRDQNIYLWKIDFSHFCLLGKEIEHYWQRIKVDGPRGKGDMEL